MLLFISLCLVATSSGEEFSTPVVEDVAPHGIEGSLVICGGGSLPDIVFDRFVELAGGDRARLVVVPTASGKADDLDPEEVQRVWQDRGVDEVQVLHTRDRAVADSVPFVTQLKTATAVWFGGGHQPRIGEAYVGTRVEQELSALLNRGGVIGGTSAGAAIQSRLMIASGNPEAKLMRGLDLVPGGVVDQHFKVRNRQPRLERVLAQHPGYYGLGVDEGTAVVIRGREVDVLGESSVTVCLSPSANRQATNYELVAGERADLTALRRAAIARAGAAFPPVICPAPHVERGSLLIAGGGKLDAELWREYVELAGGTEAVIAYVPTAASRPPGADNRVMKELREAGAKSVFVFHTRDRGEASDDEFLRPLREVTGVWFGGGRQWRIVDAYEGTAAYEAFCDVLRRGGVIGGSSAGATIQGDYLVRGSPLGNQLMSAEGYERGFALLPGVAIDQHFSQRNRLADLEGVIERFPQLLGIGIDESTAIVVKQSSARVCGENSVSFLSATAEGHPAEVQVTRLRNGESFDLQLCRRHGVVSGNGDRHMAYANDGALRRSAVRTYGNAALSEEMQEHVGRLDQQLPELMDQHNVPGVSVALISDRELVWSRGYGVRCVGSDETVQPETIMEACSMSKPFFAYFLLKLTEDGSFDIDRPLVEYLGEDYLDEDPRHRSITARMTMTHTSGLPNWRKGGWRSGSPLSLAFDPGTEFCYSGEGFLMLQRALEQEIGNDLDSLSRERLIEPLKLHNTRFVWDDRFLVSAACGHDRDGNVKPDRNYYDRANAAYSLYTSAEDYARFVVEILQTDRSASHSLSAQMCNEMLTPASHRENQQADWGLGWGLRDLNEGQQVYHSGANGSGFRCYCEFFPDSGDGLVIMTNALEGDELWKSVVAEWHPTASEDR